MASTTSRGGTSHRRPATSRQPPARPPRKKRRGFLRRFWWLFLLVPLLFLIGVAGVLWYSYEHLTLTAPPPAAQTTRIYDDSGKLLATLHAEVNRTEIPLSEMPEHLQQAVISVEDRNFYHEGAVDPEAIVRAAWADVTNQQIQQGGSTLTQQYVKLVYTGDERTFSRKIREAMLAVKLSHVLTKDEILERYLNTVYFGQGAYGVQAAAETYWGKPASELTVPQSALLAGIITAPSAYDPYQNPQAARARRNLVLQDMAAQGYITGPQAARYQRAKFGLRKPGATTVTRAPYFVSYVSQQLQRQFGSLATFAGGLRVRTTLDLAMQRDAEAAVAAHLGGKGEPAAALVAIDPQTGAIKAMVGGENFAKSQFNLATDSRRQAGSSFKAFTLAAAMQQNISLNSIWNGPPVMTIPNPECYTNGQPWVVHNYADESAGTMNLTQATANSVNTIFAQLVTDVGPSSVVTVAHAMGITSKLQPVCSITLGSQPVSPLEMTDGYATLAARGIHHPAAAVAQVQGPAGEALFRADPGGKRVLTQNQADLVTYALQQVVQAGTGTAAGFGRPAAGKTGTAENFQDAWFCGYVPQLAACVWVGYPQGEIPMHDVDGFPDVFGGSIPAEIWHDFMLSATGGMPVQSFAVPDMTGANTQPPGAVTLPPPPPPTSPSPSPSPSATATPSLPPTTPPPTSPAPVPSG